MQIAEGNVGAPFINHRYRMLRQLGSGAMGKVCLVEDALEDNQLVALKLLREDAVSAYAYAAFKNEFQAMTTFHHPHVVEVYDFGTLQPSQENFFTLEYVKGKSLLQACADATIEAVCEYALQIGRALEYIHAQGFIHFDLKPDNIMVTDDGVIKVMDFGLVEQTSFIRPSVLKGTINYLAPELLRKEPVDCRVDLYSLGAVLFHVISGRTLFVGTLDEVKKQHLTRSPEFAQNLRRPIPPALWPILKRLLEKDPRRRPSSASDFVAEVSRIFPPHEKPAQLGSSLQIVGSRSVGRDKELSCLKQLFTDRILQEPSRGPAVALVLGASGMGKTRLLQEFRHFAQLRKTAFYQGDCLQNGGRPYLPFAEILRSLVYDLLGVTGPIQVDGTDALTEPPSVGLESAPIPKVQLRPQFPPSDDAMQLREALRLHAAALFEIVGEEQGLFEWVGEPPHFASAERKKAWLMDSLCRFFVSVSRVRPLVIYCADLHWADALTLELFGKLAHALANSSRAGNAPRALLCGCVRPEGASGSSSTPLLDGLVQDQIATQIELSPLRPADVATMLNSMLGAVDNADQVAEILFARTRGNPFFVETTIHNLLRDEAIVRGDPGWVFQPKAFLAEAANSTASGALEKMLSNLTSDEHRILKCLAVFNRPVKISLLGEATGLDGRPIRRLLPALRKNHFLARGWAEGGHQYALRHDALRDHIYQAISPEERARLHAAAGNALERHYGESVRYLEDLTQHFWWARELGKVIHYAQAAGNQARRLYDYKRASGLYLKAEEAYRLLGADLAVSLAEVSSYSPSVKHLERLRGALKVADEAKDAQRIHRIHNAIGRMYYTLGRHKEAIASFQHILEGPEKGPEEAGVTRPHSLVGLASFFLGQFEQARVHLEKSIVSLREDRGSEEELSHALGMCGAAYAYLGELPKGQKLIEESLQWASAMNHRTRWALGHIYMGCVLANHGKWAQAKDWLDRGLAVCQQTGDVIGMGTGSSFRGWVSLAEGDTQKAVELCRFGLQFIAKAGGTWTFSMLGAHLAEALLAEGNLAEAAQVVERSFPVVEAGERWGESPLCIARSRIDLAQGDVASARRWAESALHVSLGQSAKPFEAKSRLMLARCFNAMGDPNKAEEQLTRACTLFQTLDMGWYHENAPALAGAAGVLS